MGLITELEESLSATNNFQFLRIEVATLQVMIDKIRILRDQLKSAYQDLEKTMTQSSEYQDQILEYQEKEMASLYIQINKLEAERT